jgi:hypothetical protein
MQADHEADSAQVVFHLNYKPSNRYVAINYKKNGVWGVEQQIPASINSNKLFELTIKMTEDNFATELNGANFAIAKRQFPIGTAKFLSLEGNVTVTYVRVDRNE